MLTKLRFVLSHKPLHHAAELLLILVLALNATTQYQNFDPNLRINGLEVENVTVSGYFFYASLQNLGYVPYWQPYSNSGQPLVDEAYSFVLNPFSYIPIWLFGDNNGIKVSIILHFMLAGVGGWFLGYTLGMKTPARLFLGALLIVKGNMQAVIGLGFYQLGVAQAYIPWILASAFAVVLFPGKRWAPVMLAVSLALTFFCGTIYFILPGSLLAVFVCVLSAFSVRRKPFAIRLDGVLVRRFVFAGLLTAGLIAVSALTIALNYRLVGQHPSQYLFDTPPLAQILLQFVYPVQQFRFTFHENYYSYIIPLWFPLLIFVLLPPLPFLHRPADPQKDKKLWLVGVVAFGFFTIWGLSISPIVPWVYANVPFIGQWRFPQRMLSISTVLLIFFMALRLDGLLRAVKVSGEDPKYRLRKLATGLAGGIIVLIALIAVFEVYRSYFRFGFAVAEDRDITACARWLREHYPDQFLAVTRRDFYAMSTYIRNEIRMESIGAAYHIGGIESKLYPYDLTNLPAEFYLPAWSETEDNLRERGLIPIESSPDISREYQVPCVWHNPDAIPYAFSVPLASLITAGYPLPKSITTPVTYLGRTPEHIWLQATPSPNNVLVVVAQEAAYPGWTVKINGNEAALVSIGQLLGVILLPGETPQLVEFIYAAPTLKIGGLITLFTAVVSVLYLLRVDDIVRRIRKPTRLP